MGITEWAIRMYTLAAHPIGGPVYGSDGFTEWDCEGGCQPVHVQEIRLFSGDSPAHAVRGGEGILCSVPIGYHNNT